MRDTSEDIEKKYRSMLLALEPAERVEMGCRMFSTAKALASAGIRHELKGKAGPGEIRRKIFLRFYGNDFSESELKEILSALFDKENKTNL